MEWAETLTILANVPAAKKSYGAANRADRTQHPDVEGGMPFVIVDPVEGPDPDVDRVQLR